MSKSSLYQQGSDFLVVTAEEAAAARKHTGATYIGGFDLAANTRTLNAIQPVHVAQARAMLASGQRAIAQAKDLAKGPPELPGATSRDKVAGKLDWHKNELAKAAASDAVYDPGADLRTWVLQAFIEYNAAEEGRGAATRNAQLLWDEMTTSLAALPYKVAAIPGQAFEAVTGVPPWLVTTGFIAGGVAVAYAVYRILLAAAPGAGRVAAERYLP